MTAEDEAILAYKALNPHLFDILDTFELSQHYFAEEKHELSLALSLRMDENEFADPRRLQLSFSGVKDLKISSQGFWYLPYIEIQSIRDNQWEGLRYRVKDPENYMFSFFCRTFRVGIFEKDMNT